MLGVAVTRNEKGDVPYAEYGLGLATQNLVLQAVAEGSVGHQMAGFEPEAARVEFDLPANARPMIVIAVGGLGDPSLLMSGGGTREVAERTGSDLAEIAFAGEWGKPRSRLPGCRHGNDWPMPSHWTLPIRSPRCVTSSCCRLT